MAKILLIDDDMDCLRSLKLILETKGHEISAVTDGAVAIQAAKEIAPDIVITDILMPGISGGMIYEKIRQEISALIPIIVCSGTKLRLPVVNDPLLEYLRKPVECAMLLEKVDSLLKKRTSVEKLYDDQ